MKLTILLKRVITGDKTWVYAYDVEIKAQSSQWRHSLTVFFDFNGKVHQEFLPQYQTVNKEYFPQV